MDIMVGEIRSNLNCLFYNNDNNHNHVCSINSQWLWITLFYILYFCSLLNDKSNYAIMQGIETNRKWLGDFMLVFTNKGLKVRIRMQDKTKEA